MFSICLGYERERDRWALFQEVGPCLPSLAHYGYLGYPNYI